MSVLGLVIGKLGGDDFSEQGSVGKTIHRLLFQGGFQDVDLRIRWSGFLETADDAIFYPDIKG